MSELPTSVPSARPDTALDSADESIPDARASRRRLRSVFGLLGYAIVLGIAWRTLDPRKFIEALQRLTPAHAATVLGVSLIHIGGRAARFDRLLLRANATHYRFIDGARVFLAGLSLSVVTPGRVGDVIKAKLVGPHGVPWNVGLGLVMIERILDLLAIAATVVGAGALLSSRAESHAWQLAALVFLAGLLTTIALLTSRPMRQGGISALVRLLARIRPATNRARVTALLGGIFTTWDSLFTSPNALARYAVASTGVWMIEFLKLALVLRCLGAPIDVTIPLFVYPVSILAGLVSEGFVGFAGVALLVSLSGVDENVATAAFVIDRAASSLPPVALWGLLSIVAPAKRIDARS